MVKGHLWCNVPQSQIGMRLHGYMYIWVQHGYYNTASVITSVFMQLSQQGPWEKVAASSKISDCLLHQSVLLSQMCLVLMEVSYKQSLSSQRKLHNSRTDICHFSMLQNTNTLASSNKRAAKSFSPGTSAGKWLGHNGTKFKAICRIRMTDTRDEMFRCCWRGARSPEPRVTKTPQRVKFARVDQEACENHYTERKWASAAWGKHLWSNPSQLIWLNNLLPGTAGWCSRKHLCFTSPQSPVQSWAWVASFTCSAPSLVQVLQFPPTFKRTCWIGP